MARTLTLLLASFLILAAITAQPVLLQTDLVANTTGNIFLVQGTTNTATDGTNVTWNMGTDNFTPFGSATVTSPSNTPYAGQFPTANWAIAYNVTGLGNVYALFRATNLLFEQLADGMGSGFEDVYTDARQLLRFPFSYQTDFTDTYQIQGSSAMTETWTYSGYGTLITPNGTFTNVVKISSDVGNTMFWQKTPLLPLIQLDSDNDGIVILPGVASVSELSSPYRLVGFPNPAVSTLQVSGCRAGDRYFVSDASGRQLRDGVITTTEPFEITVEQLAPGMYHLRVEGEQGSAVLPFVRQ